MSVRLPRNVTFLAASLGALLLASAGHAADATAGCGDCHGKDGASTESDVPVIGGMSAAFLGDALKSYKEGARYCPETAFRTGDKKAAKTTMCAIAKEMSPDDIKAAAAFFAGKKFVRPAQTPNAGLAGKGKDIHETYCEKCHSDGGSIADDDASILAGQWMPYLTEQFKLFKSGQRPPNAKMKVKLDQLQPADFDALVNYYGSVK